MLVDVVKKTLSKSQYRRKIFIKGVGNFFIYFSLILFLRVFSRPIYYELSYYWNSYFNKKTEVIVNEGLNNIVLDNYSSNRVGQVGRLAEIFQNQEVRYLSPIDKDFSVVIPKIQANSKVIANVNPANESEYRLKLQEGVAHALGTYFPGEGKKIFLFAHSTDFIWNVGTYNAVFYLLYKLETDDLVYLMYKNKLYKYKVYDKKIVEANEVHYLTDESDEEVLVLQTCWPPGTTWKRLLLFAKRIN
ncbi:MAG: hypothetical protein KatS3mg090_0664 [Patescibacteria group bacterium]|nr:MAG: hypothetical protein KatS3mg090_0664 [Patescibacteria group bacterium]